MNATSMAAPVPALPDSLDLQAFRRQEAALTLLNVVVFASTFAVEVRYAAAWSNPQISAAVLGVATLLKIGQLAWVLQRRQPVGPRLVRAMAWFSILVNVVAAVILSSFINHEDSQYFALLVVPVIEAAFRFSLLSTFVVALMADSVTFYWVWHYYQLHPPADIYEYVESGTVSLIYTVIAVLTWYLASQLRAKQQRLAEQVDELERTRARLVEQEKLAAVGRLSAAIAHEIRNPVAMISSSLAMLDRTAGEERREMAEIAQKEAIRLENLTNEFLAYARPRKPTIASTSVQALLGYAAETCRARALEKNIHTAVNCVGAPEAEIDPTQMQQALLNLLVNAIEAAPAGSEIRVWACSDCDGLHIEVENPGAPIAEDALRHLFEPFFTTKPNGTGLGLSIVRNIAQAHGGELSLTRNGPDVVCFSLDLPSAANSRKT
jgi:two-component system, NtrC family, sensor histidine kinase HydH